MSGYNTQKLVNRMGHRLGVDHKAFSDKPDVALTRWIKEAPICYFSSGGPRASQID